MTTSLTPNQTAVARAHTYSLLSRLFLDGLTPDLWPAVQQIPELAAAVEASIANRQSSVDETAVFDTLAAAHQTLFGFNVFPYESFFRDTTGLLGGPVTESAIRAYQQAGFTPETSATSADHIGHQLAFLSHLCQLKTGDQLNLQSPISNLQSTFLHTHLLPWLPPFVLAVRRQGDTFYSALADLTLAFVADHAQDAVSGDPAPLPAPPALLDDDKTSLKDIARTLTTPAYSGVYLGRADVARLARRLDLPRGFGGRDRMLVNLLKTAVQYDLLPAVITAVQSLVAQWQDDYVELAANWPILSSYVNLWRERGAETAVLLRQIEQRIQQMS